MSSLMLQGNVDNRDELIQSLSDEVASLKEQLRASRIEAAGARRDSAKAVAKLRQVLSPLYESLRGLFGEMDSIGEEITSGAPDMDARKLNVWREWQKKLGPDSMASRFIEALLIHGSMSVAQLRVAMKAGQQTVYDAASKLGRLGLIEQRERGRYSLKII